VKFVGSTLKVGTLSEKMVLGFSRRAMKRPRAARNASVEKVVTISVLTALVKKQTNIAM